MLTINAPFFPLQNAVCFIILTYLVPVLFTFYIQSVLKLKNHSGAKRLTINVVFNNRFSVYCFGYLLKCSPSFNSRFKIQSLKRKICPPPPAKDCNWNHLAYDITFRRHYRIIIIINNNNFINCKWVDTRWQWSFNMLHMYGLFALNLVVVRGAIREACSGCLYLHRHSL